MIDLAEHRCPICGSKAGQLDETGVRISERIASYIFRAGGKTPTDATGYDCESHGKFKVADTIFGIPSKVAATREQWEAALEKAKRRTRPGQWPVIKSGDL